MNPAKAQKPYWLPRSWPVNRYDVVATIMRLRANTNESAAPLPNLKHKSKKKGYLRSSQITRSKPEDKRMSELSLPLVNSIGNDDRQTADDGRDADDQIDNVARHADTWCAARECIVVTAAEAAHGEEREVGICW